MRIIVGTIFLVMGVFLHSIDLSLGTTPNKGQASPSKRRRNLENVGTSSGQANSQETSSRMSSPTTLSHESVEIKREYPSSQETSSSTSFQTRFFQERAEIKREYDTSPGTSSSMPTPMIWENYSLDEERRRPPNPNIQGTSSSMPPPPRVPPTNVGTSSQSPHRPGATEQEIRRKQAAKQKRTRLPEPVDPSEGSHIFVQVVGGRILSGVLGWSTPNSKEPQEISLISLSNKKLMVANLQTIKNGTDASIVESRCFIPIKNNLALAATLGPYDSEKQMRDETNAYVVLQKPSHMGFSGWLLPTDGKIPDWLQGRVNRRIVYSGQ